MLEEQKAVIIGGTSGIGLSAATELCRAGAEVWLTGRTPDKTVAAAAAIGDRATGHAVDARDAAKLQAFFASVGEFDDLIVALGGGSAIGAFKDLDELKMRAGFDNKFWPYLNAIRLGVGHIRGSPQGRLYHFNCRLCFNCGLSEGRTMLLRCESLEPPMSQLGQKLSTYRCHSAARCGLLLQDRTWLCIAAKRR